MASYLVIFVALLGLEIYGGASSKIHSLPLGKTVQNSKPSPWNQISVTWLKWIRLPMTTSQAGKEGWVRNKRCNNRNYFRGNRYILGSDRTIMLLYDGADKIIGIQGGISKKKMSRKLLPWKREKGHYVITAYFQDPVSVCSSNRSSLGNQLLIQNGSSANYIRIPIKQQGLVGTKWVKGGCFWSMGQIYWYDISTLTACRDLFPVFLLYNNGRLNGFGWAVADNVTSSTYVQATSNSFKYLFKNGTMPECVKTAGQLSMQHIFLDKHPLFNIC